jgi:hypothetical protein
MKWHRSTFSTALACSLILLAIVSLSMLKPAAAKDELKFFQGRAQIDPLPPMMWFPIIFRPREAETIIVQSSESQLLAQLGQATTITAIVTDSQGLLADYPVTFGTTAGRVVTPTTTTDASGVVTTTLEIEKTAISTINRATYPLTVTVTSGIITNTASIMLTALQCDDIEDRNDGPSADAGKITINTACVGSLQNDEPDDPRGGDDDYYQLNLTSPGVLLVTVRGIPQMADYDLQLFQLVDTMLISRAESARPRNADETLLPVNAESGIYYIRVILDQKAPSDFEEDKNTYILAVVVD